MANRFGVAITTLAILALCTSSAGAVSVAGTSVSLGWTAASGPVSGYYVIVSRNSAPAKVESVTIDRTKTLSGVAGETLVVQVAAFSADGVAGPVSPPSEPITFSSGGPTPTPSPTPTPTPSPTPSPTPTPTPVLPGLSRDFNGDGKADLVVQTGSDLRIWVMNNGNVSSEIQLPVAPTGSKLVGNGDYDGNRSADLLWENSQTGELTLWLSNGGAVLASAVLDRSSLPAGEEWHVGGSADFDGDGADDLMLFSRIKGEVEVWKFANASVASRTRLPGHVGAWSVTAVDDTDGDGIAEIVWVDELNRALELRDPAAAAPVVLGNLASGWRGRSSVDLSGNGSAELLMMNPTTGATQDWALDDGGVLGATNLANATGLGHFAGGGDFNGDGREDIAWSDPLGRVVTLWLAGSSAAVRVDRALPTGGDVVSGKSTSYDTEFRQRFCSGDLDGNGSVNSHDLNVMSRCVRKARSSSCDAADMDRDGLVTRTDYDIWNLRFNGTTCEAW